VDGLRDLQQATCAVARSKKPRHIRRLLRIHLDIRAVEQGSDLARELRAAGRADGEEEAVERQLGAILEADARDAVAAFDRSQLLRANLDGILFPVPFGDLYLERLAIRQQQDFAGMRQQDLRFVQGVLA
jgi:hypothetical protein